jgi:putative DNA methylase
MGARLMAIVAEGDRGRVYLSPTREMEESAQSAEPGWKPDVEFMQQALGFRIGNYGLTRWSDLFTPRQLVALTLFCDLIQEARERIREDAADLGLAYLERLDRGGIGASAYADAIVTYLGFLVSKLADKGSTLCTWDIGPTSSTTTSGRSARVATVRVTFARQALSMTWTYAEVNFLSESVGGLDTVLRTLTAPLKYLPNDVQPASAEQSDAATVIHPSSAILSTDPPYYDNIGFADLSDFFYVWLRRALAPVFPHLFATVEVPKAGELVATPSRHGGKEGAEAFFLKGMTVAMKCLALRSHPSFPMTVFYAFKQSESENGESVSTAWETFLGSLISAGFAIHGTWPMRTELASRMRGRASNALASSIVLACRPRAAEAPTATRREFITALRTGLPIALAHLQHGNIAPVDLAQAAIGPGMGIYTRYSRVLDAEGRSLSVRQALTLINQTLDEVLAEQEGDFDADTRWALAWFEQYGFAEGEYGVAETLSRAKNTSVAGMAEAGILTSRAGKVRLFRPIELPADWDPTIDKRLTVWEMVHQLIRALESGGESTAAELMAKLGSQAETARELPYRLYTMCERKKRAPEALSYNALVQSWPEISRLARESGTPRPEQGGLFGEV